MNNKGIGQMQWIISLIVIGLFAIAIIGYATNFAIDNGSAINIANDPNISNLNTQTRGSVSSFQTESNQTTTSILSSTIAPGSTTTTSGTQYAITSTSSLNTAKNIFLIGYQKIFGTNNGFSIFMNSFFAIMGFITILLVIKLWRAGLPD